MVLCENGLFLQMKPWAGMTCCAHTRACRYPTEWDPSAWFEPATSSFILHPTNLNMPYVPVDPKARKPSAMDTLRTRRPYAVPIGPIVVPFGDSLLES